MFEGMEFVVVDDDEDVPRFDRLELTHVAPVAVNGWGVLTFVDDDDDVERPEILEEFVVPVFLADERVLLVVDLDGGFDICVSDIEDSEK